MLKEPHKPLVVWENEDVKFGVESIAGTAPNFRRNLDYDELTFQFSGTSALECEYGEVEIKPGEMVLIPAGVCHRLTGSPESLRAFVYANDPVDIILGEDKMVSHTEFDVVRVGGPRPTKGAAAPTKGAVTEKMYLWNEKKPVDEFERDSEYLTGGGTAGRGMQKLRVFDFFENVTGVQGGGKGPIFYRSSSFHAEVYNTPGPMPAFHRGLDSDEVWLQFAGVSTNEAEYGRYQLLPGEMDHAPAGIAHRVIGTPEFLRLVLYAKRPVKLMIDPTKHIHKSHFETTPRVLKAARWKAVAAAGTR